MIGTCDARGRMGEVDGLRIAMFRSHGRYRKADREELDCTLCPECRRGVSPDGRNLFLACLVGICFGLSPCLSHPRVMTAEHAWLSFALDCATLIQKAPGEDDVKVESFEQTAESGKFDFTVSVEGVEIGSEATKENLKQVFGLEGGSSLDGMSSANVELTFGTPEDGKVKFTAGPKDTSQKAFFMKVKMEL